MNSRNLKNFSGVIHSGQTATLPNRWGKPTSQKLKSTSKKTRKVCHRRIKTAAFRPHVVYYGAGFLKIPFGKFLIGASLSHIVVGVPSFILANNIFSGKNLILTGILSVVALIFVLTTKGRYFE